MKNGYQKEENKKNDMKKYVTDSGEYDFFEEYNKQIKN